MATKNLISIIRPSIIIGMYAVLLAGLVLKPSSLVGQYSNYLHILSFLGISLVSFILYLRNNNAVIILLGIHVSAAVALEVLHFFISYRTFSSQDLELNILGVLLACAITALLRLLLWVREKLVQR